jgi:O-antigen chain-terminating methyltransferase
MSNEEQHSTDIDHVISRIREAAAEDESDHDMRDVGIHTPPGHAGVQRSGRSARVRHALARRLSLWRSRLRSTVRRSLGRLSRSGLRPATNRAMLQTVDRIDRLEHALDEQRDRVEAEGWAHSAAADRLEEKSTHLAALHSEISARVSEQHDQLNALRRALAQTRMDTQLRIRDLEAHSRLDHASVADDSSAQALPSPPASQAALDAFYLAFENACRGDETTIAAQLCDDYLERVRAAVTDVGTGGVMDLGCGRGEWLKVLTEAGIEASGVDLSPVMAEYCRSQGLDVATDDAVAALEARPDASLAVVTGMHIIEHLPFPVLYRLFEEVARVLRPGGLFIFETPNPENVLVGSHTFYHDATHSNPLTPTAMDFLAGYHGFHPVVIDRLHPYPSTARVPGSDPLTERVNGHLCGPQDYAIIGYKPSS